ncbi:MAG TPA: transposase [Nitrospira sp.]|nr:transposase [Nitrospira sp.]
MTDVRSGFYEHNFMTRINILQIMMASTRQQTFLTIELARLERRAAEVLILICEELLRSLSMRMMGCVEALLTEETVSVQTISWITLNLD